AAQEHLSKSRDAQPGQLELWTALADVSGRRGQWEQAETLLAEAGRRHGDSVELRLARARLWAGRHSSEAPAQSAALAGDLEQLKPEDQARLLQGLAEASSRVGELVQAERFWKRLSENPRHQNDPRLHMLLFDLALLAGREEDMHR